LSWGLILGFFGEIMLERTKKLSKFNEEIIGKQNAPKISSSTIPLKAFPPVVDPFFPNICFTKLIKR
jgi:hypothetical protein